MVCILCPIRVELWKQVAFTVRFEALCQRTKCQGSKQLIVSDDTWPVIIGNELQNWGSIRFDQDVADAAFIKFSIRLHFLEPCWQLTFYSCNVKLWYLYSNLKGRDSFLNTTLYWEKHLTMYACMVSYLLVLPINANFQLIGNETVLGITTQAEQSLRCHQLINSYTLHPINLDP